MDDRRCSIEEHIFEALAALRGKHEQKAWAKRLFPARGSLYFPDDAATNASWLNARLKRDLGLDELDRVEFAMSLEGELDIRIDDHQFEKLERIGEVVDYVRRAMIAVLPAGTRGMQARCLECTKPIRRSGDPAAHCLPCGGSDVRDGVIPDIENIESATARRHASLKWPGGCEPLFKGCV